ncbi:MAG: hypothetical protein IKK75_03210 [Clostridia bacterium]|nr:hypothetical protein [Clostridia bacterium]
MIKLKAKRRLDMFTIVQAMFALFIVDFLGYGWYICGVMLVFLLIHMLMKRANLPVSGLFVCVCILAICNFGIMLFRDKRDIFTTTFKYLLSPIIGYISGGYFVRQNRKGNPLISAYLLAIVPYFLHGFLDLMNFSGVVGYQRYIYDFWTGVPWRATLVGTYFALTTSFLVVGVVKKASLFRKSLYILCSCFSIYAAAMIASRTVVLIGAAANVICGFVYLIDTNSLKKKTRMLLLAGVSCLAAVLVFVMNAEVFMDLPVVQRFLSMDLSADSRISLFMNVLNNFWEHPFGGMPYFYSHNTWLDFLRLTGWLTFALFTAISVAGLVQCKRIVTCREVLIEDRLLVLGVMIAFYLQMFVEPIMDGSPIMFAMFFYMIGANEAYLKRLNIVRRRI